MVHLSTLVAGAILAVVAEATEIQIKLPAAGTRCFGEELQAHDLLIVKASSAVDKDLPFTLVIKTALRESSGNNAAIDGGKIMFKEDNKTEVSHAFTATIGGPHWVCVTNLNGYKEMDVVLSMKSGVHAKDYSKIAKKDHLEPAQVAIRRMEDLLHEYKSNLFYQRRREERMRETIDSTADRALVFCILNTVLIVGVGLLQAHFFRRFFRSKKII